MEIGQLIKNKDQSNDHYYTTDFRFLSNIKKSMQTSLTTQKYKIS